MTQSAKHAAGMRGTSICRDQIEEEVIRAYVRLVCGPHEAKGMRTAIIAQLGCLEIRMTESSPEEVPSSAPSFRIEVYSHGSGTILKSGRYFEFDEDELNAAVELILSAQVNQPALH
jgi:hypothetical protein